jgi:hypothetical protein
LIDLFLIKVTYENRVLIAITPYLLLVPIKRSNPPASYLSQIFALDRIFCPLKCSVPKIKLKNKYLSSLGNCVQQPCDWFHKLPCEAFANPLKKSFCPIFLRAVYRLHDDPLDPVPYPCD